MPVQKERSASKLPYLLSIILVVLFVNSIRSTINLKKSSYRLVEIKSQVEAAQAQNLTLQKDLEYVQSDQFLEQAAVEQLNLTKPGYSILVINKNTPRQFIKRKLNDKLLSLQNRDSCWSFKNYA